MAKFEVYKDRVGNYRWRLKAANGEIVAASEGYTTRFGARRSAEAVKRISFSAVIVDPMFRYLS